MFLNQVLMTLLEKTNLLYSLHDIVGVPDPYMDNLEPDEVFVFVPVPRGSINCRPFIEASVLVTRHPMHHPGDIRKLKAVRNTRLYTLCKGSTHPVIFFSIRGNRSQADCMGGGDFDGDKYIIIANEDIVDSVQEKDPFPVAEATDSKDTASNGSNNNNLQSSHLSFYLFQALLRPSLNDYVGLHTNQWLAVADIEGPSSAKALILDRYCRLALDASKSPASDHLNPLEVNWKPHWMLKCKLCCLIHICIR